MDSKEVRNLIEAYASIYVPKEEVEQIDEISADLALKASKAADIKRGKLAQSGDTKGAVKKASQASRLYAKQSKIRLNREEFDVFDVVLEFLQVEGFAETLEEAEWMMANVIDEEAVAIILEAQAARENPEKYEREQAKKSAPVRGEKTPMPPRGDKRREDFEKWYAKNVR